MEFLGSWGTVPTRTVVDSSCHDRICAPADTVAALRPFFGRLGITRVARQTGLDEIGIPCFAAIRPNSQSLATNQGKGVDDDAAMASAVMEAAEYAVAERPTCRVFRATASALEADGRRLYHAAQMLPAGQALVRDAVIGWVEGTELLTGNSVLVPLAAVALGTAAAGETRISRSTNGLASGNCREEAIFHALCELIERDATTLWGLRPPARAEASEIDPRDFEDPVVDDMTTKIADAGFTLRLFDQTSDIGIPVIYATIHGETGSNAYFDLAAGAGCHPVASRAALRAITEAAQTRITNIAGARDDFDPSDYARTRPAPHFQLAGPAAPSAPTPSGLRSGRSLKTLIEFCLDRLRACSINEVIAVDLGGGEFGISVLKLLAPGLEDRGPNSNWRPGRRATAAILGAA
jgi:YcaO-like protein with predicted kinase domain